MEARGAAKMGARRPRDKGKGKLLAPLGRVRPPGGTPRRRFLERNATGRKTFNSRPLFSDLFWGPPGGPKP